MEQEAAPAQPSCLGRGTSSASLRVWLRRFRIPCQLTLPLVTFLASLNARSFSLPLRYIGAVLSRGKAASSLARNSSGEGSTSRFDSALILYWGARRRRPQSPCAESN